VQHHPVVVDTSENKRKYTSENMMDTHVEWTTRNLCSLFIVVYIFLSINMNGLSLMYLSTSNRTSASHLGCIQLKVSIALFLISCVWLIS
jgi:hypothetical protein